MTEHILRIHRGQKHHQSLQNMVRFFWKYPHYWKEEAKAHYDGVQVMVMRFPMAQLTKEMVGLHNVDNGNHD